MDEIFLEDEETGLLVSNLGRVVGDKGKFLKGRQNNYSHLRIAFRHECGKKRDVYVHRLVARNFISNPLGLPFINHKDEDPTNNCVDNLEWCTPKYNSNYGTLNERMRKTQIERGLTRKCVLEKDGVVYKADSVMAMSRMVGIVPRELNCVLNGSYSHINGFHIPGVKRKNHGIKRIPITLTNGRETIMFNSLSEASRHIGASVGNIPKLRKGVYKQLNGWKVVV